MRITTNLSFMLLALAAGAVALHRPSPDPVKPGVRALVNGVSSHTFSPPFFCFTVPPFVGCYSPFFFQLLSVWPATHKHDLARGPLSHPNRGKLVCHHPIPPLLLSFFFSFLFCLFYCVPVGSVVCHVWHCAEKCV